MEPWRLLTDYAAPVARYTGTPLPQGEPSEIRQAILTGRYVHTRTAISLQWTDVDLMVGEWRFTTSKTGTELIVPLAKQAVTVLIELKELTGRGLFVFPNPRDGKKCMSENGMRAAMISIGLDGKEVHSTWFQSNRQNPAR